MQRVDRNDSKRLLQAELELPEYVMVTLQTADDEREFPLAVMFDPDDRKAVFQT